MIVGTELHDDVEVLEELDLGARTIPGLAAANEPLARLEDERLDLGRADAEHGRDVLMRVIPELEEHKRRPLVGRQPLHVVDELPHVLAPLDLIDKALEGWMIELDVIRGEEITAGAQLRQASVARDRVQPWPERNIVRARLQCPIGGHERQLQRVLGRLAIPQHMRAEREHPTGVAVVDVLEGGMVAGANAGHQVVVGDVGSSRPIRPLTKPDDRSHHPH